MLDYLKNERGFAMIVVLVVLLMTGLIGIASIQMSTTDMGLSDATTDKVKSFYLADGGLELAIAEMKANPSVTDVDSLTKIVNAVTMLGDGYFEITLTDAYPVITVVAEGHDRKGESAVSVKVQHRRNSQNPWNNALFAGVGQAGQVINGNVGIHGSVHLLGIGEKYTDLNDNGSWDAGEPWVDEIGNGVFDPELSPSDVALDISGSAVVSNNYSGMPATLSSRVPSLPTVMYNGESVESLEAELRIQHGKQVIDGSAMVGDADVYGGPPAIKETMDGVYVTDGFDGNSGSNNVYSDNGYSNGYDLPDGSTEFPSLNGPSGGYATHREYLSATAAIVPGDIIITWGVPYTSPPNPKGSLQVDALGNMTITGSILATGNIIINSAGGKLKDEPFVYDGKGTLASMNDMDINASIISKDEFPTNDVMGFIAYKDLRLGTAGGASHLVLMGAFYAQNQVISAKQNEIAGTLMSNFFSLTQVPTIYQIPTLAENLPPSMPGGNKYSAYTWVLLNWTWREL